MAVIRRTRRPHAEGDSVLNDIFDLSSGRASNQEIRARFVSGAKVVGPNMTILIVAMLIASIGLNTDSTEAIVGAMLICPLMGSVMAMAYGIATADRRLIKHSITGLLVQMGICLCTSTLYFAISPLSNTTSELLTNSSPTIWDVLIAAAGGTAGAIGTTRKKEPPTLVSGVAVATALMPPLCTTGYGIATRSLMRAAGGLYEFLINVVFIALACEVVLIVMRVPMHSDFNDDGKVTPEEREEARQWAHHTRIRIAIATAIFLVPCLFISASVVQQTMAQNNGELFEQKDLYDAKTTAQELEILAPEVTGYSVGEQDSYDTADEALTTKVVATVTSSRELDADTREKAEDLVRLHAPDVDEVNFLVA